MSFICGDFNYDLAKSHLHNPTSEFYQNQLNNGYIPTILKPTRVTHTASTLIDNIFVRAWSFKNHHSYILVDGMSDHYPCLSYSLLVNKNYREDFVIEKWKLNENVMLKIQQELLFEEWTVVEHLPVNKGYELLVKKSQML